MPFVHSVSGVTPPRRYDSEKWTGATLQESADPDGPFVSVESFVLADYPDPLDPPAFNFTSSAFSLEETWLRVVFIDDELGTVASVAQKSPDDADGYPSTEELVGASAQTALTDLEPSQQEILRLASILAIEAYCGQKFTREDDTTYLIDAQGGALIYLPRRLRAITEAVRPGTADPLELSALTVEGDGSKLVFLSNIVGLGYYEQALQEVSGDSWATGFPNGQLYVTGDWGWEQVPDAIVTAIRYDMEDQALADSNALSSTVAAFRKLGLQNISQGNLRADMTGSSGLTPRVTRLLDPYVFFGRAGHLV